MRNITKSNVGNQFNVQLLAYNNTQKQKLILCVFLTM